MDLYTECLKMKAGESQTFKVDRDLGRGEIVGLVARLGIARNDVAFSILRNGRIVSVNCYIPEKTPK